jgi:ferredoxin-type protein NapH
MDATGTKKGISPQAARKALKIILAAYIGLCVVIAGLNFGYAGKASPRAAEFIHAIYQIYENELKTVMIIVCGALAWSVAGAGRRSRMRKANLIGFGATAVALHVVLPLVTGNREIYYVAMPPPWSTTALQLLDPGSSFHASQLRLWGAAGIAASLAFAAAMAAVVFIGTALLGRRWQCSTLCLLNGFVAEIWTGCFPLAGKVKSPGKKTRAFLRIVRRVMIVLSLCFLGWWIARLAGLAPSSQAGAIARIETFKYLCLELLMAMFFWIAWTGRGYCYYCPLGSALSAVSLVSGQQIATDKATCISCGQCSKACPMGIDVAGAAALRKAVRDMTCVGCGHCVDACPTGTLRYETAFLRAVRCPANKKN